VLADIAAGSRAMYPIHVYIPLIRKIIQQSIPGCRYTVDLILKMYFRERICTPRRHRRSTRIDYSLWIGILYFVIDFDLRRVQTIADIIR